MRVLFFFQAEDGIRDVAVTGVQTCALPILAFAAEFPDAAAVSSPPYSTAFDVADEWAMKVGGQYRFDFGLTVSYFWEEMHRSLPDVMQFQNERQRTGDWLALDWVLNGGTDRIAVGWAHAGATPG